MNNEPQLLLGILALQNGFITKEQLVAAFSAWTSDKSRSLESILMDQGVISESRRTMLAWLAEEHLKQHDNDVGQSLASIDVTPRVKSELEKLADPELTASISLAGTNAKPSSNDGNTSSNLGNPSGARYVSLKEHAEGGLGKVFLAIDHELNRNVALKEILPKFADDFACQQRFVYEAEVTGQLEHPGIVPIYGLGTYSDGKPYYAMRFIEGETLQEAIDNFHKTRKPSEQLIGNRAVEFRNLLNRFIDICNAIEYAHSRQVLHRDLKPKNILLGPYGETLVVDWGLAKANATPEVEKSRPSEEKRAVHLRSGSGSQTIQGQVVGTPAYMSPEQAAGKIQELGTATDIYALGAILYAILTGRAPVEGDSVAERLRRARESEIAPARSRWSSIPKPLEAVCHKAMSAKPSDRYSGAKAIATEIEKWLADEPVSAFRESIVTISRRWIRRHKSIVSSALVAITLSIVGGLYVTYRELEVANERRLAEQKSANEKAIADQKREDERKLEARERELQAGHRRELEARNLRDQSREAIASQPINWIADNEVRITEARELSKDADGGRDLRSLYAQTCYGAELKLSKSIFAGFDASDIAWSPDGTLLAVGANHQSNFQVPIRLFAGEDLKEIASISFTLDPLSSVLRKDTDGVRSLLFSKDGERLYCGSRGGSVYCWSTKDWKPLFSWKAHADWVTEICEFDDKRIVTASRDKWVIVWNKADRSEMFRGQAPFEVRNLRRLESQLLISFVGTSGLLEVDFEGKAIREPKPKTEWAGKFSMVPLKEEAQCLLGEVDGVLALYDPVSFGDVRRFRAGWVHEDDVNTYIHEATLSSDNRWLIVSRGRRLHLVDFSSGERFSKLDMPGDRVFGVSFHPKSTSRFVVKGNGTLDLYEVVQKPFSKRIGAQAYPYRHVGTDQTNFRLIAASWFQWQTAHGWPEHGFLSEWNLNSRATVVHDLGHNDANAVCVSKNGTKIAILQKEEMEARVFDRVAGTSHVINAPGKCRSLEWSATGETLIAIGSKPVIDKFASPALFWLEPSSGRVVAEWSDPLAITKPQSAFRSALSTVNYDFLAAADRTIRIFDAKTHGPLREIGTGSHDPAIISYSEKDSLLFVGTNEGKVLIVEPKMGVISGAVDVFASPVRSLACSADLLACGSAQGICRLFQIRSGAIVPLCELKLLTVDLDYLALSTDGTKLIAHQRNEAGIWEFDLAFLRERFRELGIDIE